MLKFQYSFQACIWIRMKIAKMVASDFYDNDLPEMSLTNQKSSFLAWHHKQVIQNLLYKIYENIALRYKLFIHTKIKRWLQLQDENWCQINVN